ncbi:MAG: histidine kinase dimerization/phospho-acceptor domain-containing protein, partial [Bacteroidota bacterium]
MVESGYDKSLNSSLKRFPENTRIFLYEALKNSPLPLLIFDDKMRIVSFDKQFSKFIQKNDQGSQYDNIKSLFPESFPLLKKAVDRLSFQDRAEIRNFSFKDKKNKELIGSAMVVAHKKNDLRLYLLYLSGFELRKPSNLLKNTAEFDEFIYHLTNTGKWLLDVDSGDFSGSTICYEILGLKGPDETLKFKEILNLISSREEKENLEKDILKVVNDPQKTEREFRIKPQDSSDTNIRYIRLVFDRIGHEKKYVGGIIEDATEYKKAEKNLRKSISRIEKTDRFKSVFLTNLSHEIRTPMNAILGYSELLNQPGIKQEDIGKYTSIIKNKGNYLLSLIDDVIEISRFESGKIKFNYKEFLLLPLLKELYEEYESLKKQKGKEHIDIVLDVPEDAGEQLIYTDYGRLQQVLSNLLSN